MKHLILAVSCMIIQGWSMAQTMIVQAVDTWSGQAIPFVSVLEVASGAVKFTDAQGTLVVADTLEYVFSHPLYHEKKTAIVNADSLMFVQLEQNSAFKSSEERASAGESIISMFHHFYPMTSTTQLPGFEFISYNKFDIYQQTSGQYSDWVLENSFESIEKNRFRFPDKKYTRIVTAQYSQADNKRQEFTPINSYTLSPNYEYIPALDYNYLNPMFNGATKRYEYVAVDTFAMEDHKIFVVAFQPKKGKRFLAFSGLFYFSEDRYANIGGIIFPHREQLRNFRISYSEEKTSKDTYFVRNLNLVAQLRDIPNYARNTRVDFSFVNTLPTFDINNTENSKWVDMAVFSHTRDTSENDTWMMRQVVDDNKLEYIRRDTIDDGFVLSKTFKLLYNIYDGRLGYRVPYFDINNVFAINKFESVRIGLGLQSHEHLSDLFTFGGYFGYGIGDGKFKYGANIGFYLGTARSNLLSLRYRRDLLEPGLVNYLNRKEDLVRNFFTSRMDDYQSNQISLRTRINAYVTSVVLLNNYRLRPLYDYTYSTEGADTTNTQEFGFSEISLLFNIGTPFTDNPAFREILFRKKRLRSNLFLNVTKGIDSSIGGDFEYWKLNGRLASSIRINRQDELDVILEGGAMTPNQPYQINYGGPGTEFKLTGIIINNAFQTMKLYGFFADRYVHSFLNYNFGNVILKKSKFKPELALALNLGWGRIKGRRDIHQNIDVRDYPDGYFEGGILLNNLLRMQIYNYFYGGLGLGMFVGFGPEAESGSFAVRLSYEIGTL